MTTIAIASDHAGFHLKSKIIAHLRDGGFDVLDLGTDSTDSTSYADYGFKLARAIADGTATRGIAICGTGIGISIALNRYKEVRAAPCHDVTGARLVRLHNDANVLALGARMTGDVVALDCVDVFLATPFEGGRHTVRIAALATCGT